MILTSPSNQWSIPVSNCHLKNSIEQCFQPQVNVDYEYEYTNECQCNGLDKVRTSHNFTLSPSAWHTQCSVKTMSDQAL